MIKIYEADQFDLFGGMIDRNGTEAYARKSDPDTSHEAAESVEPTKLEATVLDALQQFGKAGATAHELVAYLNMPWQTVSPRLAPLVRKGFAIDTGLRRPGPSA